MSPDAATLRPTTQRRMGGGVRGRARVAVATGALLAATIATLASLTAGTSFAQLAAAPATPAKEEGIAWGSLTLAQQTALAPLRAQWPQLDGDRKTKWLNVAARFAAMPLDEQRRVQARMSEWAAMTPAQRGQARQQFQELRNLPTSDRQALWEAYRALPADQRQVLAERARPAPKSGSPAGNGAARAAEAASATDARKNVPVGNQQVIVKPVSPTLLQAKPGATTTLVSQPPTPPLHNQPGLPKITTSQGFVNPSTLLPIRGAQGAAAASTPSASAAGATPKRP